mmetsp:Transcript_125491/g.244494  ORF Transcript_125491/g.244494 Transcript_125491/m.244494 type:complete len:110 (-) Transcript_125491:316-645(-)
MLQCILWSSVRLGDGFPWMLTLLLPYGTALCHGCHERSGHIQAAKQLRMSGILTAALTTVTERLGVGYLVLQRFHEPLCRLWFCNFQCNSEQHGGDFAGAVAPPNFPTV